MSDIDTVVVDSLKALDPEWPIREADVRADVPGAMLLRNWFSVLRSRDQEIAGVGVWLGQERGSNALRPPPDQWRGKI